MSTNHRPRLETKKGIKRDISGSIAHARGTTQQMGLKYRHDQVFEVNEVKDEMREKPDAKEIPDKKETAQMLEEKDKQVDQEHIQTPEELIQTQKSDTDPLDSDSEDEEELLKELEKLKKPEQPEQPLEPKKSWRKSKFKKPKVQEEYTNSSIGSKFHQDFLNKFVK